MSIKSKSKYPPGYDPTVARSIKTAEDLRKYYEKLYNPFGTPYLDSDRQKSAVVVENDTDAAYNTNKS
jgi:hypothetical protein